MNRLATTFPLVVAIAASLLAASPASAATLTISGTVQVELPDGSFAAPGSFSAYVRAVEAGATGGGSNPPSGSYDWVSGDGTFALQVPPGHYQLAFSAEFGISETAHDLWLGNTPYQRLATVLDVTTSSVTGVAMTLPDGSTLSGTIHAPAGAEPGLRRAVLAYAVDPELGRIELYARSYAVADEDGDYTLLGMAPGDYMLRFFDYWPGQIAFDEQLWNGATAFREADLVTVGADVDLVGFDVTLTADGPIWLDRLDGPDRIATSIAISQAAFPADSANVVYLANGLNYPDALSAAPAAATQGGPLLLAVPWSVRDDLVAEIDRLSPAKIVIVGGTNSISAASEAFLVTRYGSGAVERLGGANRYETSRMVAEYAFPSADTAFIATGYDFPDALAAGPAAAVRQAPVVLVPGKSTSLDPQIANFMTGLGVETIFIVGGTPSVSAGIEAHLRQVTGVLGVERFGGQDRYHTATMISGTFFPYSETAFLAAGWTFPDALAGSAAAGSLGFPIYLTQSTCIPGYSLDTWRSAGGTFMVTLGSDATVSNSAYELTRCPI